VKILVLGHSDSEGIRLARREDAWPWLIVAMLHENGIQAEVTHRNLYPGPTAAAFVQRLMEREAPDIVVVCTTTHGVVVQLVSNRMRARWGERAGRLAERAERAVARRANQVAPHGSRAITAFRRAGRKILGTQPALSAEGLVQSYEDVMMTLARFEDTKTIIGGGIGYIGEIRALNPGIDTLQARFQRRFREAAERHRFDWLSHEEVLGGPGAKDQYYYPDGIHTDERSHRLFAEALLPLIVPGA
jgi:hypothetical protein